jgi:hypothetical protein
MHRPERLDGRRALVRMHPRSVAAQACCRRSLCVADAALSGAIRAVTAPPITAVIRRGPRFSDPLALTGASICRLSNTSNGQTDGHSAFCQAPQNGAVPQCPSNSGRFTLSNSSAERPHARKITAVGCATRSNSILSSWYSGPSAPLSPRSAEGLALRRLFGSREP